MVIWEGYKQQKSIPCSVKDRRSKIKVLAVSGKCLLRHRRCHFTVFSRGLLDLTLWLLLLERAPVPILRVSAS